VTSTVLVVSSVHSSDDPRIRLKLIGALRRHATVHYLTQSPGPADADGITVELLKGARWRRTLAASRRIIAGDYDVASVHDPELLPAAAIAGVLRRRVVFDVHEDIPAQLRTKPWLPGPLGPMAAWCAAAFLRVAERVVEVTLAEPNYATRFRSRHPVFPNYLSDVTVDVVPPTDRSGVVYLGDITEIRGLLTAVEGVGLSAARPHLTLIGRCGTMLQFALEDMARAGGVDLRMPGFLPLDEALAIVATHRVALSPLHDVPNYHDSLPTKILEYLAAGVPVVASDLPGGRAVVGDLDGIVWVAPGDPMELASGVDLVLGSEQISADAAAVATVVRDQFQWPAQAVRDFYLGDC
jgi:glycosyltransferase involved in cell wall biosynthesis